MTDLLSARRELGISQSLLAAKLGCSRTHYLEMESGEKPLDSKALAFLTTFPRRVVATPRKTTFSCTNKPKKTKRLRAGKNPGEPSLGCSVPKWEKWWFSAVNPVCVPCRKSCKQSAMVKIVCCPQREVGDE